MEAVRPRDPGVEPRRDVDIRGVLLSGFWLAATAVAIHLAMYGLFQLLEKREERTDKPLPREVEVNLRRTPPEPRLEPDPLAPRRALAGEEQALLSSYGWVDRGAGTVHIPIERAMELTVARGVPGGKAMPAGAPLPKGGP